MILGAVLVGGRSSRFGSDKARAEWHGRALADHAAAVIGQHVDQVVAIGGPSTGSGHAPIHDLPRPHLGPLGGIAGALDHAATHGFRSVLTIGCDMPRVPSELLTALLRRAPAYCSDAPVLGHWSAALGAQLLAWVEGEDRSVFGWASAIGALPIASPVPLGNVNTPADLAALAHDGEDLLTL
ncbi:molybdenum cofactor guanylyltransferase [Sphingomonas sp.]|uniref:molybdenum cofactor guanylyltransferase n=1 Tax=Sphingomonas sp. TaxID=28214 RepID=UPI003B009F61